jgi:hypothetical protein
MDLSRFVKMCRDCGLVDKKFTVVDAELCFLKAKKKASMVKEYSGGVFFGKRISYKVFRHVLIRCIMEKKEVPIDRIIHALVNAHLLGCYVPINTNAP